MVGKIETEVEITLTQGTPLRAQTLRIESASSTTPVFINIFHLLQSLFFNPPQPTKHTSFKAMAKTNLINILAGYKKAVLYSIVSLLSLVAIVSFLTSNRPEPKIVIVLAANEGGGVQRWKTPQDWSVERSSITNKKNYAKLHGYTLAIKDVSLKRRYSHEWREGWEKADILKQTMRQYPDAEWFWWLDLHTFIMEPQISLEDYLIDNLEKKVYRSLNYLNPLHLKNDIPYVNIEQTTEIDLVLAQDCGGFNLGSFFIRRSEWTDLLLDLWWDPAMYEQKHMEWEHKEQDCLETLYSTQPWIRERVGFVPLRAINSFPPGACSDQADDTQYFYNENERDFVVNMAGCNFGDRSCWDEYERYRDLERKLHKKHWYQVW